MIRGRDLLAALIFLALAIAWSFPLAGQLSTHLPGRDASDNVNFLWNFWWMREALASPERFFFTPYLFAPAGTDLTLHTHTALPAAAGATLLRAVPIVTALNVTTLAGLFLNGLCAYLLARRSTDDEAAALFAGVVFAGSPYLAAHLNGHFNLTHAWTIPLFALLLQSSLGGSAGWAAAAGLVLGATAYIDYYYVIYEAAFAICACALEVRDWSIEARGPTARSLRWSKIFAVLAAVDLAILAGISATGGFERTMAGIRIQARDVFNPLQVLWALIAAAAYFRWRPRIAARPAERVIARSAVIRLVIATTVALAVAAPIVWNGAALMLRGEYVTQRYFWRSAPKGIDAATLVLGHPFHGAWGAGVRQLYGRFHIDAIEGGGWLGIVPLALGLWAVVRLRSKPAVKYWAAIAAIFLVWALGPHLMVFGWNSGMILPQTLLRYIPIAANARIPGRTIVLVYLALGILGAIALADLRRRLPPIQSALLLAAAVLAVGAEYIAAPFPTFAIDRPSIYTTLRDRPEPGILLELPVGIRDSFVGRGFLDHRVLAYQTIHRRPIVGGVVSRLARSVQVAYAADPLIDGLLVLSERSAAHPMPDRALARQMMIKDGIGFVMLNRETAPAPLVEYVDNVMPLMEIASEGTRTLYVIE